VVTPSWLVEHVTGPHLVPAESSTGRKGDPWATDSPSADLLAVVTPR
jgi:hypothetical protein